MSLLALAHHDRLNHKPQPTSTTYAGPVDPRYGRLPGWVADHLRTTNPSYASNR
jgi:hypothetical protein